MSESKMKIKDATKCLEDMICKLEKCLESDMASGMDDVNVESLEKVSNAIHYLCEGMEKKVKALYYAQIMEAMENSEYGEDYDENGALRGYRGRSATTGRYVHRAYEEMVRDMDRHDGKMGYPNVRGYEGDRHTYQDGSMEYDRGYKKGYTDGKMSSSSRFDVAKRGYETADHTERREKMQQLIDTLEEELTPYAPQMDANEKSIVRNGMQRMINKFA